MQTFNKCVKTVGRFELRIDDNLMSIVLLVLPKTFTQLTAENSRCSSTCFVQAVFRSNEVCLSNAQSSKTSNVSYSMQFHMKSVQEYY